MGLQESTEELVEWFQNDVTAEGERFDAKSQRIFDTTGGKKKLVRHIIGMANNGGGTILIGLVDNDGRLEDVELDEPKSELRHVAASYSVPSITPYYDVSSDRVDGNRLLRIDIEGVSEQLIRYTGGSQEDFPTRDHDNTVQMPDSELEEWYRKRGQTVNPDAELTISNEVDYECVDTWYCIRKPGAQLSDLVFAPYTIHRHHYWVNYWDRNLSWERVEQLLAAIQRFLRPDHRRAFFSVSQSEVCWVGQGLGNFFEALRSQDLRYQDLTERERIDCHHSETAMVVMSWGEGLVILDCISDIARNGLEKLYLRLFTDGIPVDVLEIDQLSDHAGIRFERAHPVGEQTSEIRRFQSDKIEMELLEPWLDSEENPWVAGGIFKNPFYGNSELFEAIICDPSFDGLTEYEHVYGDLNMRSHPVGREDVIYELDRVYWTRTSAFEPSTAGNIVSFEVSASPEER